MSAPITAAVKLKRHEENGNLVVSMTELVRDLKADRITCENGAVSSKNL